MQSEAEHMDATLSNLDPYIILSNARRICNRRYQRTPNWSLAMEIFGLGSTYAWALCHRMGVDGDGRTVARSLSPDTPQPEAKEAHTDAWPNGCHSPSSCTRHMACMYTNCRHENRSIKAEIEAAIKAKEARHAD